MTTTSALPHHPHGAALPDPAAIDVETLRGRRAVNRWERTSVGDIFERLTWSRNSIRSRSARPRARTARSSSPP